MEKFKKGDKIKVKVGCVWMLGVIDECWGGDESDMYEVSYDKKNMLKLSNTDILQMHMNLLLN